MGGDERDPLGIEAYALLSVAVHRRVRLEELDVPRGDDFDDPLLEPRFVQQPACRVLAPVREHRDRGPRVVELRERRTGVGIRRKLGELGQDGVGIGTLLRPREHRFQRRRRELVERAEFAGHRKCQACVQQPLEPGVDRHRAAELLLDRRELEERAERVEDERVLDPRRHRGRQVSPTLG
jgi:hypothetical protein